MTSKNSQLDWNKINLAMSYYSRLYYCEECGQLGRVNLLQSILNGKIICMEDGKHERD